MSKRKVIIDTDPGIDDLLALSLALASEELEVLAISTVFGNVSLENTVQNAQLICDVLEKDITIIEGVSKPIFYENKRTAVVHGEDGMGGLRNKYRKQVVNINNIEKGIKELYNLIKESKEKITIIAIGPLTNIATLLLADDSIKDNIDEIHVMGGGDRRGNTNELAEFNFFSDSYAAKVVLTSGLPVFLSGLDVTSKVYFTEEELSSLANESFKQKFIKESVEFYAERDPYMHDVCAILTVTHPELFTYTDVAADVITSNDITDGMQYILRDTTIDKNVKFVDTDKRKEIIDVIFETIEKEYI